MKKKTPTQWAVNITHHESNAMVKEWGYTEANKPHGTIMGLGRDGWEPVGFQIVKGTLHVMWKQPTNRPVPKAMRLETNRDVDE